ncbi:MAG: cupin domain-containing protein [Blastocatellia bacterium AA13]|nr:MAG: cupin domain-containing protein [Blastocatellia bacterium AA13]
MRHFKWDEIPVEQVNDKFIRKLAWDGKVMIAWMECKKGCYVPAHSHENEQLTFVISGQWRFEIDGKTIFVGANEMLHIPSNVVHSAEAVDDLVAYDIFTPPREDWIKGEDAYLRNAPSAPPTN